jgi:hypothetical protein
MNCGAFSDMDDSLRLLKFDGLVSQIALPFDYFFLSHPKTSKTFFIYDTAKMSESPV